MKEGKFFLRVPVTEDLSSLLNQVIIGYTGRESLLYLSSQGREGGIVLKIPISDP